MNEVFRLPYSQLFYYKNVAILGFIIPLQSYNIFNIE